MNSSKKILPKKSSQKNPPKKILPKNPPKKNPPKKFLQKNPPKNFPMKSKNFPSNFSKKSLDFENIQFPTSHLEAENHFRLISITSAAEYSFYVKYIATYAPQKVDILINS